MLRFSVVCALVLSVCAGSLLGQHAVDPTQGFHRLICLVHLTGSGKASDPVLPEYVPGPGAAVSRSGIIAWSMQRSDDGKMAIIHLVAVDRNAFQAIFADKRPEIRVFEIGKDSRADIEKEMKKYKKDFDLDSLQVVAR